jgi:glycosyltransferase involved in cell wall biosynthesis
VKILYVSQYFPPEMGAPAARVAELARHWVRAGHEVTVLTGFPNHPTGVIAPEYRRHFRRGFMREEFSGAEVIRTWLLPLPNRKAHERILNYGSFCASAAVAGTFVDRPDVVIATSPQLLVGLSGCWIARWKHVPFIFEVRDLWPESLVAVGMGNDSSPFHRSLARVAGYLYKHSSRIVVVSPAFRQHLTQHWQIDQDKISVIENGVETDLFQPKPSQADDIRTWLGADNRFVVSYIGTMGMAHGLETLLESAQALQTAAPKALFLFMGEGSDKDRMKCQAARRGLRNVIFLDERPRERMPDFISASDVCLVPLKKTELFKTVIPTKLLEFMACARPVILGVEGEARRIVESARAGLAVEPENPVELAQAILRLLANPELSATLGRNGRRYILENFSRKQKAAEYLEVLAGLIEGRAARTAAAA